MNRYIYIYMLLYQHQIYQSFFWLSTCGPSNYKGKRSHYYGSSVDHSTWSPFFSSLLQDLDPPLLALSPNSDIIIYVIFHFLLKRRSDVVNIHIKAMVTWNLHGLMNSRVIKKGESVRWHLPPICNRKISGPILIGAQAPRLFIMIFIVISTTSWTHS